MTEKLLHFIWKMGYFNSSNPTTISGERIQIINKGTLNTNAGPDFLNARLKIGNVVLAGSVELHLKTTDWQRHGHEDDSNYANVILHVVYEHDNPLSHTIPVLELQPLIPAFLIQRYERLMNTAEVIPCGKESATVSDLTWIAWKGRLLAERLAQKAETILNYLHQTNSHWEETFWWLLARNFGMKVNADAFETIARSIPLAVLAKQKSSPIQIEALLFGQAGLLTNTFSEAYPKLLQREYAFLKKKYNLQPSFCTIQFLRMRPGSFPTIRLAQLAALVHRSEHLFSKLLEAEDIKEIEQWLDVTANDYWHYHYRFDEISGFKPKRLGTDMLKNILINTVIPMLYAYGLHHKNERFKSRAVQWLEELKPENNSITQLFESMGQVNANAFDSQAYIQLKNNYCQEKRCLECAIGASLLKRAPLAS